MKFLLIVPPLALLLASCSTISYKEPESGARARVRFVSDTKEISVLRVYDDESCTVNETEWMRLRNGPLINSSPKKIGMPPSNYHDNAAKEVYVSADKQLNAFIKGEESVGSFVYLCAVPFFYKFAANKDYEVFFNWSRSACNVTISQLVSSPSGHEKQVVEKFTNQPTSKNDGCIKAFKKTRLY